MLTLTGLCSSPDTQYADLELPVIQCVFETEKIKLAPINQYSNLLLNFFKRKPFFKCNFEEILTINKIAPSHKERLKEELQTLLTYKKLVNNASYFDEYNEMCVGLSVIGESLYDIGHIPTNDIQKDFYTIYYDVATNQFLAEDETENILPEKESFFYKKEYRFLKNYLFGDNGFLNNMQCSAKLPISPGGDSFIQNQEQDGISARILDGYYFSKQRLTKKKLTSRCIKNGLILIDDDKNPYHINEKFKAVFSNYADEFIQKYNLKVNESIRAGDLNFNTNKNTLKFNSLSKTELEALLANKENILFLPEGTECPLPAKNIIRISKTLFPVKSEFAFYIFAKDFFYSITPSFFTIAGLKDYLCNKIDKESFFQSVCYSDDTADMDVFREFLTVIEQTNSIVLFAKHIKKSKKITLKKLLSAHDHFKNSDKWNIFFRAYVLEILFKDIMSTGFNHIEKIMLLQKTANITDKKLMDLIEKTNYRVGTLGNIDKNNYTVLECQCLWYDTLLAQNFSNELLHEEIRKLKPFVKEKKEISETVYNVLSEHFRRLLS